MKIKYLAFLLLFIFNFTETSLADASHFDSTTSIENIDCDHEEKTASSNSKGQDCQDHHCSHSGHIHVYIQVTESEFSITNPIAFQTHFPAYLFNFSSISFDIIKPPIV